jgi:hypothetical protein
MNVRSALHPQVKLLESRIMMSATVLTSLLATPGLPQRDAFSAPALDSTGLDRPRKVNQSAVLTGQATGSYVSRQGPPDTGTRFHIQASGTITPVGSAVVTGWFSALGPINNSVGTGHMTIVGPHGKLRLKLTEPGVVTVGVQADDPRVVDPSGRLIEASAAATGSADRETTTVMYRFPFRIIRGIGAFLHDRGTGTVVILNTPALRGPVGPKTHSSSLASTAGLGRTVLTFSHA